MKIINEKRSVIHDYAIDYENSIQCHVHMVDGKLDSYNFYKFGVISQKYKLNVAPRFYYISDLEIMQNTHWSDHRNNAKGNLTIDELSNFKEFNKLFTLGVNDGVIRDINWRPITSLQHINETTLSCYDKLDLTKKCAEDFIARAKNCSFVKKVELYEIPYYNRQNEDAEEYSVNLTIMPPQDLYEKCFDEIKDNFWSSESEIWFFDYINSNY